MTEDQFRKRARTILAKIIELQSLPWPEEWTEQEQEQEAEALDKARWAMHDVAYPA